MIRGNDGPLPALIACSLVVCLIATLLGYPEMWFGAVAAIVVVLTLCQPKR